MELIPAIDLAGGRVVRLHQGDFDRSTDYGGDPLAIAARWVGEGATRLHIVDLDGAREGRSVQGSLVRSIVESVPVPCQVAGGIRGSAAAVAALEGWGADRVVLGSALLRDPELGRRLVDTHGPERLVAAIDVRGGRAVGSGWVGDAAGRDALEAIGTLRDAGVAWFAVTAIDRDGTMEGPDVELLERAQAAAPDAHVIASAGVTTVEQVRDLARRGMAGAILGRALYEGRLDLRAALAAAGEATSTDTSG